MIIYAAIAAMVILFFLGFLVTGGIAAFAVMTPRQKFKVVFMVLLLILLFTVPPWVARHYPDLLSRILGFDHN